MTPIRIASQLTPTGIEGVRWVLVDADEGGKTAGDDRPVEPEADDPSGGRKVLRWLLQAAVIVVALVAASLTTRVLIGRADDRAPALESRRETPLSPRAAAPASAGLPTIVPSVVEPAMPSAAPSLPLAAASAP